MVSYYNGITASIGTLPTNEWAETLLPADFGGNWDTSENTYRGFLTYSPLKDADSFSGTPISWSMHMPKYQPDDLYTNTFRINRGDSVTMFYKDGIAISDFATNFISGTQVTLDNSATYLTLLSSVLLILFT